MNLSVMVLTTWHVVTEHSASLSSPRAFKSHPNSSTFAAVEPGQPTRNPRDHPNLSEPRRLSPGSVLHCKRTCQWVKSDAVFFPENPFRNTGELRTLLGIRIVEDVTSQLVRYVTPHPIFRGHQIGEWADIVRGH